MKTYGDAGDQYPVQPGEVYQVGPHVLACGDHERDAGREFIERFARLPALSLSDPPWGLGYATGYRTKAGVKGGAVDWPKLRQKITGLLVQARRAAVIEMGNKEADNFALDMISAGWVHAATWPITYYAKRPCSFMLFTPPGGRLTLPSDPTDLDEPEATEWAVKLLCDPGEVVFDPCMGQGLTATTAHRLGRHAAGVELHPRRLAVTIRKLVDLGCPEPVLIGNLESMR